MRWIYDLGKERFVRSAKDANELKGFGFRFSYLPQAHEIVFCRDGSYVSLANGAEGALGFKASGDFDGDWVINASGWVASDEVTLGVKVYTFTVDFNTTELRTALGINPPDPSNDKSSVTLSGEITWSVDDVPVYAPIFTATVANILHHGGEGGPNAGNPSWGEPTDYLTKAGNLDGLADVAEARTNLGLGAMLCRNAVTGPVDFETAGVTGDYWFDSDTGRLWVYVAGQFRYTNLISE